MSARSALVTGGAGFIGSHLVDALLAAGWQVRVLDDFSSGREENLEASRDSLDLLRGDLRDPDVLARVVAGVVYAASSSAYGDTPQLPKVETMPANPRSPYALQKWTGETYCRLYSELYGLETVALRYFNVYGPRQNPASEYAAVVPRFIVACLRREQPVVYGDGGQTRDFTFVEDAVRANLLAADAPGAVGAVINVAGGRRVSLNELLAAIAELCGAPVTPRHEPARAGDVRDSLADLGRARSLLGYEPAVPLRQGLLRTIESLRKSANGGAPR